MKNALIMILKNRYLCANVIIEYNLKSATYLDMIQIVIFGTCRLLNSLIASFFLDFYIIVHISPFPRFVEGISNPTKSCFQELQSNLYGLSE